MAIGALVVDDSPVIRKVIRYHLAINGVKTVYEAEHPTHAWQIFRAQRPVLVTLDLLMPGANEMTARDLFDAIRRESPETAIIIVSAIPFEKTRSSFAAAGATYYIVKPFNQYSFEPARQKLARLFAEFANKK